MQMSFEWITPAPPFANNNSPKSAEAVAAATVKQPRPRNLFSAPSSLLTVIKFQLSTLAAATSARTN